jgi:hypothetical protein
MATKPTDLIVSTIHFLSQFIMSVNVHSTLIHKLQLIEQISSST